MLLKKKKALNRTQQRKKLSAHSTPSLPFSHAWDRTQPWNFLTSEGISLGIRVEVISVWRSAWVISMEICTPVVLRFVRSCSDLCFDSWDHGCRRRSGRGSWLWCLFCRGAGFLFLSWVAVGFYFCSLTWSLTFFLTLSLRLPNPHLQPTHLYHRSSPLEPSPPPPSPPSPTLTSKNPTSTHCYSWTTIAWTDGRDLEEEWGGCGGECRRSSLCFVQICGKACLIENGLF